MKFLLLSFFLVSTVTCGVLKSGDRSITKLSVKHDNNIGLMHRRQTTRNDLRAPNVLSGGVPDSKNIAKSVASPVDNAKVIPCDGQVIVMLDRSSGLSLDAFNNQLSFVGIKLFSSDIFSKYARLSLGSYGEYEADSYSFGDFTNSADVLNYVQYVAQDSTNGSLWLALANIESEDDPPATPFTAIVFVSTLDEATATQAQLEAQRLQDQGARVYLVAHGDDVSTDLLAKVNGDASLVYRWEVTDEEIPDYANWFKKAIC